MGSFGGHALPGSFFVIFGVWWTIQVYRRYYKSLRKGAKPFRATATYRCDCLQGRARLVDWEGILKVFFTTVGLTLEIITAYVDGKFSHLGNGQHATMFAFFGMSGIVDIIVHHQPTLLPRSTEYLIGILAFTIEGLLFMFHTHGRTPLDVLVHQLLVYAIALCVVTSAVELKCRNNALVPLSRAFAVLLQGTWFWQAGFILYNPSPHAIPWDEQSHDMMMIITMMFAWHAAAIFVFIIIVGLVVRLVELCRHSNSAKVAAVISNGGRRYNRVKLLPSSDRSGTDENQGMLAIDESEDDETTFQETRLNGDQT